MGVGDDNEALLPRVAWLNVLDVVLGIEHEGGLLVACDLEVLIGEGVKDSYHVHFD